MNIITATRPIFSLTYVSSATDLFSASALIELLRTCRRNNAAIGVSGMLLYKDGNFMQVLEGEEHSVRGLHEKILRDPRHHGSITLLEGEVRARQFGDWSMGFRNLADPKAVASPGYNEYLSTPLDSHDFIENPSRAKKLLASFKLKM